MTMWFRAFATVAVIAGFVALSGCSRRAAPAAPEPPATTAAHSGAAPAVIVNEKVAEAPATERATGVTEESATAELPSGMSPVAAAVAATTPAPPAPEPGRWVEGRNYVKLVPVQPTHVAPGRVEVLEVFWYGCGHCFHLDPLLESWRAKGKPAYVDFARAHVMWNNTYAHARLYYTIKELGRLEELHPEVFREIHVNGDYLAASDPGATERVQRAFLTSHGTSGAAFDEAYRSFSVDNDLRDAEEVTRRYKVTGVPLLIVNGKYSTDVGMAGGEPELIALINYLAAIEHRR